MCQISYMYMQCTITVHLLTWYCINHYGYDNNCTHLLCMSIFGSKVHGCFSAYVFFIYPEFVITSSQNYFQGLHMSFFGSCMKWRIQICVCGQEERLSVLVF